MPPPLAFRHVTVLTATGQRIEDGTVVVRGGRIEAVGGAAVPVPDGTRIVEGRGRFVTPGIIDTHSHLGVYPEPGVAANADGNEMSAVMTPGADAAYAYWAQDPAIARAAAGGVTVAQILPGSGNLVGGRSVVVEMRPGRSAWDVAFPGARRGVKMACGENPKRVHGAKSGPMTRMGEYAVLRDELDKAREYLRKMGQYRADRASWEKGSKKDPDKAPPAPPERTQAMETWAGVLRGQVLVQIHCYRADDMRQMMAIADEYGFAIRSFHHALEAYKIRDELAARGIAINTWADWWGFKMEAFDGIPENAALFHEAGGRPTIHSDSPLGIQRLNQEAAKAYAAGRAAGVALTEDDALRWITANAAWVLGIDGETGTLEPGKRADVVLWSAHPFSTYAVPELVLVAGAVTYDRAKGLEPTDFELGTAAHGGAR